MTIDRHKPLRRAFAAAKRFAKKKPAGPTARARKAKRAKLVKMERDAKVEVRERDRDCRFPKCGCKFGGYSMKNILTVSHDFHKGIGGDPTGKVSIPALMILLCKWRHQDAPVSRHAGTMKTKYLTPDQNDGPIAFLVDLFAVYPGLYAKPGVWLEVARETYVEGGSGTLRLEPLTALQSQVLTDLAEMER